MRQKCAESQTDDDKFVSTKFTSHFCIRKAQKSIPCCYEGAKQLRLPDELVISLLSTTCVCVYGSWIQIALILQSRFLHKFSKLFNAGLLFFHLTKIEQNFSSAALHSSVCSQNSQLFSWGCEIWLTEELSALFLFFHFLFQLLGQGL